MKKIKISFVIPESLQRDLKERMIKEGYDLKGKSRWISEAIMRLLQLNAFVDLVKVNDEMKGFEKQESVLVEPSLKKLLDDAIVDIRRKYPTLEGVQSRIVRTSILQRLL